MPVVLGGKVGIALGRHQAGGWVVGPLFVGVVVALDRLGHLSEYRRWGQSQKSVFADFLEIFFARLVGRDVGGPRAAVRFDKIF